MERTGTLRSGLRSMQRVEHSVDMCSSGALMKAKDCVIARERAFYFANDLASETHDERLI